MPSKKRKEQEWRNLLKKSSGNFKALKWLFQNSAGNGKDYAHSEIKDSEPGIYRNEIIRIMVFILPSNITKNINKSRYYTIMADEVTDRVMWNSWSFSFYG